MSQISDLLHFWSWQHLRWEGVGLHCGYYVLNSFAALTGLSNTIIVRMCMITVTALPPLLCSEQNWRNALEIRIVKPNSLVLHLEVFEILFCFSNPLYHLLPHSSQISTYGFPLLYSAVPRCGTHWSSLLVIEKLFFLEFHSLSVSCVPFFTRSID